MLWVRRRNDVLEHTERLRGPQAMVINERFGEDAGMLEGIIWVLGLVLSLSLLAGCTFGIRTAASRIGRGSRIGGLYAALLVPLGLCGAGLARSLDLVSIGGPSGPLWYLGSWGAAFVTGSLGVLLTARKRRERAGVSPFPTIPWLLSAALALCGLVVSILLLDGIRREEITAASSEELARLEGRGATPSSEENAAALYEAAHRACKALDHPPWVDWLQRRDFDAGRAEVTDFLEKRQEALALIRRGAELPGGGFPPISSKEFHSSFLEIRVLLELVMVDAMASARAGAGELRQLGLLDRMEGHIASEPAGIGHLLLTVHAMDRCRLEERLVRNVQDRLSGLEPPRHLPLEYFIDLAEKEGLHFSMAQSRLLALPDGELFRASRILDAMGEFIGFPASGSGRGRVARLIHRVLFYTGEREAFRAALRRWCDSIRRGEDPDTLEAPLRQAFARGWETFQVFSLFREAHRQEKTRRLAHSVRMSGRAAALFRRERGTFPASIGDLVPDFLRETPLDPADGKPLEILIEPGGAIIRGRSSDNLTTFALGAAFERLRDAEALRLGPLAYEEGLEHE